MKEIAERIGIDKPMHRRKGTEAVELLKRLKWKLEMRDEHQGDAEGMVRDFIESWKGRE